MNSKRGILQIVKIIILYELYNYEKKIVYY